MIMMIVKEFSKGVGGRIQRVEDGKRQGILTKEGFRALKETPF